MPFSAAFGRLRVETTATWKITNVKPCQPPSGGCVLKQCAKTWLFSQYQSAAFGRLRVETELVGQDYAEALISRLRAAAC